MSAEGRTFFAVLQHVKVYRKLKIPTVYKKHQHKKLHLHPILTTSLQPEFLFLCGFLPIWEWTDTVLATPLWGGDGRLNICCYRMTFEETVMEHVERNKIEPFPNCLAVRIAEGWGHAWIEEEFKCSTALEQQTRLGDITDLTLNTLSWGEHDHGSSPLLA